MTAPVNIKSVALLAWALVNVALVLAIGSELGWGKHLHLPRPAPVVHRPVTAEITLPPDYRLPALDRAYAETLERPLFVPTRRKPPPPPPPAVERPTMKKGQFLLLGTTITDELKAAIVKEVAGGKVRQVVLNQTINGLRLEQVEADSVVFTQYDDREELRLKIQPSPKAPPPGQTAIVPGSGGAAPQANAVPPTSPRARVRRGNRTPVPSEQTVNQ